MESIIDFFSKFSFIKTYYPMFISGALHTILISLLTVFLGTLIGILLALMKLSKTKILKYVSSTYIEIIRGTPALVQVFIWYYMLSPVFQGFQNLYIGELEISRLIPGVIALSLNSGAYVAEIIRAGILAVDKGQIEAGESLGMKKSMYMRYIIMPQAIKNILPALGNEFIVLIKESSILFAIGLQELMTKTQIVYGTTFLVLQSLLLTAIIYFILTFTLSRLLGIYERRLRKDARN